MTYSGQIWVPPTTTSFSNLNFISGTTKTNSGPTITLYVPPAAGDNLVGQSVAAPATPYSVIACVNQNIGDYTSASYAQQTMLAGLGFYDGTRAILAMNRWNSTETMGQAVYEWSTVSGISSKVFGQSFADGWPTSRNNWFQVRDDGTNITFFVASDDGQRQPTMWTQIYQQARLTWLSNVNNICWACDSNGGTGDSPSYITLTSFQIINL